MSQRRPTYPRVTTLLIVFVAVESLFLTVHLYWRVTQELTPENLVNRAENIIRSGYPEVRDKVVADIRDNAPEIAEDIHGGLLDTVPELRKGLTRIFSRQLAKGLDQATELSAKQFRSYVQNHREDVRQSLHSIQESPENARRLVREAEDQLDQYLGLNFAKQAASTLRVHRRINNKLEKLS